MNKPNYRFHSTIVYLFLSNHLIYLPLLQSRNLKTGYSSIFSYLFYCTECPRSLVHFYMWVYYEDLITPFGRSRLAKKLHEKERKWNTHKFVVFGQYVYFYLSETGSSIKVLVRIGLCSMYHQPNRCLSTCNPN